MNNLRVLHLGETLSTNTFLATYTPLSPSEVTLATADYQTAGRGQTGNTWESERGKNLLFSLLVQPSALPSSHVFVLSEAIALSIREAVRSVLADHLSLLSPHPSPDVTVKWPNDIYVGDCKIAGILIENQFRGTRLDRCIIGCGVNVNQSSFAFASLPPAAPLPASEAACSEAVPTPTSLLRLTGHDIDRRLVLDAIVNAFIPRYEAIQGAAPAALAAIHADYLAALYRRQGFHPYRDARGLFHAEIADVEPTGHLILRDTQGLLRRYAFKEVAYVRTTPEAYHPV